MKIKAQLATGAWRVVNINENATNGATLGVSLFGPTGVVATPAILREYIFGTGGFGAHSALTGLQVGDDHPQYTMWAQAERITGQWTFAQPILGANGTAELPSYTFSSDPNTGVYRVGADNIGLSTNGTLRWDVGTVRVNQTLPSRIVNNSGLLVQNTGLHAFSKVGGIELTTIDGFDPEQECGNQLAFWEQKDLYGFRFRHEGDTNATGDFRIYRHNNSSNGVFVMGFARDSSQVWFASGSVSAPSISFEADTGVNTGFYRFAENTIGVANGGNLTWTFGASAHTSILPLNVAFGTAAAPGYAFDGDADTGMYRAGANQLGWAVAGSNVLTLTSSALTPTVNVQGVSGSATSPPYSFSGDPNTGVYAIGADSLGFATGGNLRFGLGAAGEILDASGSAGSSGQVVTSGGSAAAWSWQTPSGGGGGGSGSLVYVNTTVPGGNTVSNTATETAFTSSYDIPANSLAVGSVIRVLLWGRYGTDGAVAPTLRIRLKLDTTTVADTTAITTTTALTNSGWRTEVQLVVTALGASGTVDSQGWSEFSTAATTALISNMPNTAGITVDTTQILTVSATAQWGGADTDNTITLHQMAIWVDNATFIAPTDVQVFTASGSWTKPTGATSVEVICIGGGGGGGSGRRGAAGSTRPGGGGGGAGGFSRMVFAASGLSATETVTVGAAGTGGAAVTVNSTNGSSGTDGTLSRFGNVLSALGGVGGTGGAGTTAAGGAGGGGLLGSGGAGGTGGTTTTATAGSAGTAYASGGGGGGHGVSSADNVGGGSNPGGGAPTYYPGTMAGGTAGAAGGGNGGNGNSSQDVRIGSGGGGGGGANTGVPGGTGGNGASYGAGGGGGGGVLNGQNSGAGGNGGGGLVVVISYF